RGLLPDELHPRLELRADTRPSLPRAGAHHARDRFLGQYAGEGRYGVSDAAAAAGGGVGRPARGRRADGLRDEAVSRVAAFRRHGVLAAALAGGAAGGRVRLEEWLGPGP